MDEKTLGGGAVLVVVLMLLCGGGEKKKAKKPHRAPAGWVCDENGCKPAATPTAPAVPVNQIPGLSNGRLQILDGFYKSQSSPAVDLPVDRRQKNWVEGGGSCVNATGMSLLRWYDDPVLNEIADTWPEKMGGGGESAPSYLKKLKAVGVRFVMTDDGDVELIKWAIATRRGCGIAYAGHCVAVVGYDRDTNEAIILDNNHVKEYTRRDWDQMISAWQRNGHGPFAYAFVYDPPAPVPNVYSFSPLFERNQLCAGIVSCSLRY